jgi:hypothetical protein
LAWRAFETRSRREHGGERVEGAMRRQLPRRAASTIALCLDPWGRRPRSQHPLRHLLRRQVVAWRRRTQRDGGEVKRSRLVLPEKRWRFVLQLLTG